MEILGLDIGGTGIKAAVVDTATGQITQERFRLKTPQPPTPEAMVATAAEVIDHFKWTGLVGCGFPAVVKRGIVYTANNIDSSWIGKNAETMLSEASGCPVRVGNDADVAALAEIKFGAGHGIDGLLVVITLGTGVGSGMAINGKLIPNTEFGQIYMANGLIAEKFVAESAKKRDGIKSEEWGVRVNDFLLELERLFLPDLIILGGGGSKKFEKMEKAFQLETRVVPAEMRNLAGIIGAALLAEQ